MVMQKNYRVALVGPELEENLGLEYLQAACRRAGHRARLFDFYDREQVGGLARRIVDWGADVVGLSMVFTGRAREFVALAERLRAAGFAGHLTAGGHFASFHADRLLRDSTAFDSVLRGEGEESLVELLDSLDDPSPVSGVTYRRPDGGLGSVPPRRGAPDIDAKPWPARPERFRSHLGFPIANMLGSRGCYGRCSYCSIAAWYEQVGGPRLRQRRVDDVADEMARLYHGRGVRIFNFHDDNFFLRSRRRNLERFATLRKGLNDRGVGRFALQIKARPDDIDEETLDALEALGLFRVFLGVESDASEGLASLRRGVSPEQNRRALELLAGRGVHAAFNLLLFYPDATLAQLRRSVRFIGEQGEFPLNFGRAEVYSGTPLMRSLRAAGNLSGDYLGYGYRIADRPTQIAYELWKRAFLERNFDDDGMAFHAMRIDYSYHLLRHFHPDRVTEDLGDRVRSIVRALNRNSAAVLERICDFAEDGDLRDHERFGEEQRRTVSWVDGLLRKQAVAVMEELERLSAPCEPRSKFAAIGEAVAAAALSLVVGAGGCDRGETSSGQSAPQPLPPPPVPTTVEPPLPPVAQPDVAAPLPAAGVEIVERRITAHYQPLFDALASDHSRGGVNLGVDLTLDANGSVTGLMLRLPAGVDDPAFEQEIERLVRGWQFPGAGAGTCSVRLVAATPPDKPPVKKKKKRPKRPKKPRDPWVNEMMMSPIID